MPPTPTPAMFSFSLGGVLPGPAQHVPRDDGHRRRGHGRAAEKASAAWSGSWYSLRPS